ncbi:unnamed protein product [Arabis nemorensis]|uniref:Uncharacterized protein n=1 Tax=Arabis nemorensis TaxID=586526 RepID=A0A565C3Y6_9BRAS|nr:unnamed protein product [Arabis nemorensis]
MEERPKKYPFYENGVYGRVGLCTHARTNIQMKRECKANVGEEAYASATLDLYSLFFFLRLSI